MDTVSELQEVLRGSEEASDIEMAIRNIIKDVNRLNQILLYNQNFHMIYFEDDVYQMLKNSSTGDVSKLINRLLRVYFLEK